MLGLFWGKKVLTNWSKNGTHSLRISGFGELPKCKMNERCRKGKAAGLIPRKRKGAISSSRASQGPKGFQQIQRTFQITYQKLLPRSLPGLSGPLGTILCSQKSSLASLPETFGLIRLLKALIRPLESLIRPLKGLIKPLRAL